ncbi:Major Facilitator Superfamily protein [Babesia bovis T2Bo]|uniref:Major Facilitator Superfamily protein n=1 Tax=Babesia bovis T2Bo TaxID=484906 RepID=UPI001D352488|nr:Major Facilitator Superfamily protein [Babesia bovis T2Bo]EDO05871.2 Major Facilitator Superfamily protein [Babesia bovis T2Bo]
MIKHNNALSLMAQGNTKDIATEGHCEAEFRAHCYRASVAMHTNTYRPLYEQHLTLGNLCDEKERTSRRGTKTVIGAAMLYLVIGYPAQFAGMGLHIASYMGVIGNDERVGYKGIAAVYLVATAFQAMAGLLTSHVTQSIDKRMLTRCACLGISMCIMGASAWLHNYTVFLLLYGVGAGLCSGLVMWLPAESVIKHNPNSKAFSCSMMYAIAGTVLTIVGPLQLAYLSPWWLHKEKTTPTQQRQIAPNNWYYNNTEELYRTKKIIMSIGIVYLLITIIGIRWAFPEMEPNEFDNGNQKTSEYVPFAIKERNKGNQDVKQYDWCDKLCTWLLSFFTWQAVIYIHSCWRSTAVLEYKVQAKSIVATELFVRCVSLVGRVIWGLVLESHGWRQTWIAFSLMLLAMTVTLTQFYKSSFALYVAWLAAMYFANSAIFCVVPITANQLAKQEEFTQVVGIMGTSRALAGATAFTISMLWPTLLRQSVPGLISLLSVGNLVAVNFCQS